ncbi:MAG: Xaa-Pro peptidase family protein [Alphaproteobacteria bacterium]|nr:Xaa-Pro peptidase family protein [Alphaproteobacteria bacterium]
MTGERRPRSIHRAPPPFTRSEFEQRIERARALMTATRLDALLIASEANLPYFSGLESQIAWISPSRPWHMIVPLEGEPVAVIPASGLREWRESAWVGEVRTWRSPNPENEGLDLLAAEIKRTARRFRRIGVELGQEARLAMAPGDLMRLLDMIRPVQAADCQPIMRQLRFVKSKAEIARLRHIGGIVSDAFADLSRLFRPGMRDADLLRALQADILLRGADKTPYMVIGSGRGGYDSTSLGPTGRKLTKGDVFQIDTGSRYGGYFCDFCRNYAVGKPTVAVQRAYDALWHATQAGIEAAMPGRTAADLFHAQARVIEAAGFQIRDAGRMGHGLGRNITEPPSNKPDDHTVLVAGATVTIEPMCMFGRGKLMVHEENLVVTDKGPLLLSRRAPVEITLLSP